MAGEQEAEDDLPDAFEAPDPPPERAALPLAGEFAADAGLSPAQQNHCLRCGNSCRSIYLWQGDLALFKERDTKRWVEYHAVDTFTAALPDGKTVWGIKLDKPCTHLIETDPGLFGCAIYDRRPYVCRIYRGINPDGPQPGCGFGAAG